MDADEWWRWGWDLDMWITDNLGCWHALFVSTGQEEKVRQALEMTFRDQMRFIVPKRELRERKVGKWHIVKRNLFPGYVLVKGAINIETYYRIKQIPMLTNLLRDENGPQRIDERELGIFNILIDNEDGNIGISTVYKVNEMVRVVDGPLVGLEGSIQSVDARKGRAKVKIDFLGYTRIVQLGIDVVDRI